jgi:hypothetical protein
MTYNPNVDLNDSYLKFFAAKRDNAQPAIAPAYNVAVEFGRRPFLRAQPMPSNQG